MKRLTIFTPTYNRAHLLPKLYESLKEQTNKDFIWLIIDDGSKDDTKQVVEKFKKEKKIEIDYHYKENGGKNSAMDYSNQVCKTDYIACVDSDDLLTKDSCDKVINLLLECDKDDKCVGIVSRRFKPDGLPFINNWAEKNKQIYFNELATKYGYTADTYLIFKTDIVKRFKFPIIEGEKFLTEAIFYNQFLYEYTLLTCEDNLYIGEYMPDGYTADGMKLFYKNPKGYYYYLKSELYHSIKYIKNLKKQIGLAIVISCWKKLFAYKNLFKDVYKVTFIYKILGGLGSLFYYRKYKKKYNEFLANNDKNR